MGQLSRNTPLEGKAFGYVRFGLLQNLSPKCLCPYNLPIFNFSFLILSRVTASSPSPNSREQGKRGYPVDVERQSV